MFKLSKLVIFSILVLTSLIGNSTTIQMYDPSISGGEAAQLGEAPWQVAILNKNKLDNLDAFRIGGCGGTIINNTWILTAAHCLRGRDAKDISIYWGSNDLSFGGKRFDAISTLIHPDFNQEKCDKGNCDGDIALVELLTQIDDAKTMQILSKSEEDKLLQVGSKVKAWGWGLTEFGEVSKELKTVGLPIIDHSVCAQRYKPFGYPVTHNMICAGFKTGGYESCSGDSGGPLTVSANSKGGVIQVGIVSWGVGCAEPENYGVYTKVSNYREWILKNAIARPCVPNGKSC